MLQLLVVGAALAVAASATCQTSKPAGIATGDRCSGVMEGINEARGTEPGRYTKALVAADDRCLGVMERLDKARMITRGEYVKAFKREPDCSVSAYSYLCE